MDLSDSFTFGLDSSGKPVLKRKTTGEIIGNGSYRAAPIIIAGNGTYAPSANMRRAKVKLVAGGGGGGGVAQGTNKGAAGGGGGETAVGTFEASVLGTGV